MMAVAAPARRLPFKPVPRDTVQDRVHRQIRDLILDGEIEPGQTVTLQSLADAFGVSIMPVREALHRLTAEKALTVIAGRSVGIPPLSVERFRDLRRVRIEIEGVAARWAAESITAEELARLDELIATMEACSANGEQRAFVPANREFHFAIYRAARSDCLMTMIEPLWLQIGPYLALLRGSGSWRIANNQHRSLAAALARRDGEAARRALVADIDEAAALLERILIERAGTVAVLPR